MNLLIKANLAKAIGEKVLEKYGFHGYWGYHDRKEAPLAGLSPHQVDELEGLIKAQVGAPGMSGEGGARRALRTLRAWRDMTDAGSSGVAPNARAMTAAVRALLAGVPGHRVYRETRDGHWLPYFAESVKFTDKRRERREVIPAHVTVALVAETLWGPVRESIGSYEPALKKGKWTAGQWLALHGYAPENKERRAEYLQDRARFERLVPMIGQRVDGTGFGTDDLDGNDKDDEGKFWWRTVQTRVPLGSLGEPAPLVVDVDNEANPKGWTPKGGADASFWLEGKAAQEAAKAAQEGDDYDEELDDEDGPRDPDGAVEVPVHPILPTFHLRKHIRLRVHAADVEDHVYDRQLSEKLIIPETTKRLVRTLVEHKSGVLKDIVSGKAGGAVVLLAGAPGTGKTLTAEVFAESEGKPLYAIQCSQLGVRSDKIEQNLERCFARGRRWNAVILLDEADVYVRQRKDDIVQNAIVGIFLRALEYQQSVMFLTTNRAGDVDDAIASRCVARLEYGAPSAAEQRQIWSVLAEQSGIALARSEAQKIASASAGLSGRDVKHLLTLAALTNPGEPITLESVEAVKQFRPTGGQQQ